MDKLASLQEKNVLVLKFGSFIERLGEWLRIRARIPDRLVIGRPQPRIPFSTKCCTTAFPLFFFANFRLNALGVFP